jgi:hypothetical protein
MNTGAKPALVPKRQSDGLHGVVARRPLYDSFFGDSHPRKYCADRKCGKCLRCQDDARWNRIYAEKFEDPEYYSPRCRHPGSSLSTWHTTP